MCDQLPTLLIMAIFTICTSIMRRAPGIEETIAVRSFRLKRSGVYPRRRPERTAGWHSRAARRDLAAERGWVWFRHSQHAVSVVHCQCYSMEVVQFLLVRPINRFLILSKCSLCLQVNG